MDRNLIEKIAIIVGIIIGGLVFLTFATMVILLLLYSIATNNLKGFFVASIIIVVLGSDFYDTVKKKK